MVRGQNNRLEMSILANYHDQFVREDGRWKFKFTGYKRSFEELAAHLGRALTFPDGVFLFTGTGIVPDPSFTLQPEDVVRIAVDGLGVLENPVVHVGGASVTHTLNVLDGFDTTPPVSAGSLPENFGEHGRLVSNGVVGQAAAGVTPERIEGLPEAGRIVLMIKD